ncbi:MAG: potassium channel protein [Saprospiraceae bacterium]
MQAGNFFHFTLLFLRLHKRRYTQHRFRRFVDMVERIRMAGLLMLFSIGVGTVGYVVIEHYPWLDAYYMAVITLASVGFGEVHPLSAAGRIFTTFLILFNVGLFAYAISTIAGVFAEGGFFRLLNDFRMNRNIENLNGHAIICGFGRHATEVSQELAKQGIPFVIIENDLEKIELLRETTDYLFVEGDATNDEVLEEAGIRKAGSIVITLPKDSDNLFVTLSARQMNAALRIITRANSVADEVKIRRAGANHTVVPERIGGFYMATLLNKPDLVEFFNLLSNIGPSNVVFEEVSVQQLRAEFQGKTIADSGLRDLVPTSLIAIRRLDGQYEINPSPATVLKPDWHVVMFGNPEQMALFRQKILNADTGAV